MKTLTQEQKEYIKEADTAVIELEEQFKKLSTIYTYDILTTEQKAEQAKVIHTLKDFITWSLNNIRQ